MKRIPEPELMDSPDQSEAYSQADFAESNSRFVDLFCSAFPEALASGAILDLGCGDGDIPLRLAPRLKAARIVGVDGADAMLAHARARLGRDISAAHKIEFVRSRIQDLSFAPQSFSALISNSVLHHLHDPAVFWSAVKTSVQPGGAVFVMDLFRQDSPEAAVEIVEKYAGSAPPLLRRDFYNSLLAAFTPDEVKAQMEAIRLSSYQIRAVSDRHFVASARV